MRWIALFPHLLAGLFLASALAAEENRTWTTLRGQKFDARLVAADGWRGTFEMANGKRVIPLSAMSGSDVLVVREWRRENPRAPLVDPAVLDAWPAEAVAANYDVRIVSEDRATGSTHYESAHFAIASDVKLPLGVVRDLAAVFEATRVAVMAAPVGLHSGIEPTKYRVRLFSAVDDYSAAGGPAGSGGFFNGRDMLLLLPNLGIRATTNGLAAEHQQHLFVLKHEVSHQLMAPWLAPQPVWLGEGMAEIFAAAPYTRGRFTFQSMDAALRAYVLKWRATKDTRTVRLIPPDRLMAMTRDEWQAEVAAHRAYDLYNSAALLTHWFLRYDGRGDGAGIAAFYEALHQRESVTESVQAHLVRGRKPDEFVAGLRALARKLALEVTFE